METQTRADRQAALDQFAQAATSKGELATISPAVTRHDVYGAQPVAVYRDDARVLQQIKVLAAAMGEEWYYRYPVRNKRENRTDYIEGPSIKLANDLARIYGNCEVDCRAQDMGSAYLFHARFLDLETGFALTRPFQQRKGAAKIGGDDDQRREDATFQIGVSKAMRNVVVNALQTYSDYAMAEAKNSLVDRIGRDLAKWRDRTIERVGQHVEIARVEAVVGRKANEWLAPDVARVIAMGKACDDGFASWQETFPPLSTGSSGRTTKEALDGFADERSMVGSGAPSHVTTAEAAGAAEMIPSTEAAPAAEHYAEHLGVPAGETVDKETGEITTQKTEAEVRDMQRKAIDMVMRLAGNPQLTLDEKMQELDAIGPALDDLPEQFVKTAVQTAAKVAQGKMKAADARPYLEGLIK